MRDFPSRVARTMKLKICGLKRLEDISFVNQAKVDYAGFVFAPSRQQVSADLARQMKAALDPRIKAVGVFVGESPEFVKQLVEEKIIDIVQFHGDVEYALPCPTIRAFSMNSKADIKPTMCDFVLFDAQKSGTRGKAGGVFDWRLIDGYEEKPFFLAGGINITNIRAAAQLNPYCIDLSSGAEDGSGQKSLSKILELKETLL